MLAARMTPGDLLHEVGTTQVLAVFAYNVAQLPQLLPRKPPKKKTASE